MTVEKFIEEFKNTKPDKIEEFLKSHIVNDYIPYNEKIADCTKIINVTAFKKVELPNKEVKSIYRINSPLRFQLFSLFLILKYTDIQFDIKNGAEIFDELNKNNLINVLISCIKETEYNEYSTILAMLNDDLIENTRSVSSLIETKLEAIENILDLIVNKN